MKKTFSDTAAYFQDFETNDMNTSVSYTHLRAHETLMNLVCRLLLEKSTVFVWIVLSGMVICVRPSSSRTFRFLMIRRPPRSTRKESSAASDVYKRQVLYRWFTV